MKNIIKLVLAIFVSLIYSCDPNGYIRDLYVAPDAKFEINKEIYNVFESVKFTNKGKGQAFVVYPGDYGHVFGKSGDTGFTTASDGTFSYSYSEAEQYNAVWVASSMDEAGNRVTDIDSVKVKVVAMNSGLDFFQIYNVYKMTEYPGNVFFSPQGIFVSNDTLMCPILFDAWRTSLVVNSIKAPQLINFTLASPLSKFFWVENGTEREIITANSASRIINFLIDGKLAVQKFVVKTGSGINSDYFVAPVIIPKMTKFSVLGINGTIQRDIAYYNQYNISISLPAGTNLSSIVPTFEIMNNDINLVGNNIEVYLNDIQQTSGISTVDASNKALIYRIKSYLLGTTNKKLVQESVIKITFL